MNFATAYIDRKYIGFVQNRLRNFSSKDSKTFCFTHSCERAESRKRRGYFLLHKNAYYVVCHNCGYRASFSRFLKETDPVLSKEYRMELFKEGFFDKAKPIAEEPPKKVTEAKVVVQTNGLVPMSKFPRDSFPWKYLTKRMIPEERIEELFLVPKFYDWAKQFDPIFEKFKTDHPRLVIQLKDKDGKLLGYNCRSFGDEKPKYIQLRVDKEREFLYGLDRVDQTKPIIALEGQIDSMFLPNAIAVGNASYTAKFLKDNREQIIIVPDNDFRRNVAVCQQIEKAITRGFWVCFLPAEWPKDINDAVRSGISAEQINEYILSHKVKDIRAKLLLTLEKKC